MSDNNGRVLITGAAKRLGRAMALALAQDGYDLVLHYNSSVQPVRQLAKDIRKKGRRCHLIRCNLSHIASTKKMLSDVNNRFGKVDILVNNASTFIADTIKDTGRQDWQTNFQVNLLAPYVLTGEFANQFKQGCIINIIDAHVTEDQTKFFSYLLAKKALRELTRMSAKALGPKIRVNGIAPGAILPPAGKSKDYLKKRASLTPLKRPGTLDDIVQALRFLIGHELLTGEILFVDGGQNLN